jgi:hypothetical protein
MRLVWLGPFSWLLLGVYLLIRSRAMWDGLFALYVGLPIILVIHIVVPLLLLGWMGDLRRRGQRIDAGVGWGLAYYAVVPCVVLASSIWLQGVSGTVAWGNSLIREILFQLERN